MLTVKKLISCQRFIRPRFNIADLSLICHLKTKGNFTNSAGDEGQEGGMTARKTEEEKQERHEEEEEETVEEVP